MQLIYYIIVVGSTKIHTSITVIIDLYKGKSKHSIGAVPVTLKCYSWLNLNLLLMGKKAQYAVRASEIFVYIVLHTNGHFIVLLSSLQVTFYIFWSDIISMAFLNRTTSDTP